MTKEIPRADNSSLTTCGALDHSVHFPELSFSLKTGRTPATFRFRIKMTDKKQAGRVAEAV
jgi:hypothetical protein